MGVEGRKSHHISGIFFVSYRRMRQRVLERNLNRIAFRRLGVVMGRGGIRGVFLK